MARDEYMGSDTGIMFYTYSWATIFYHATMAKCVRYKFDGQSDMSVAVAQFAVWNYLSNPTPNLKANLENLNSFPAQVQSMSSD